MPPCVFCKIISAELPAQRVIDEDHALAILDHRPLFPGHVLVLPREHHETLTDLPVSDIPALFATVQRLAAAVERALDADGTFVAMNNKISQSVPHLHVHVVPRRKKDGLKGFFWPRNPYKDAAEMADVAAAIRRAL